MKKSFGELVKKYTKNDGLMVILLCILSILVDTINIKFSYGINITFTSIVLFYTFKRIDGTKAVIISLIVYLVTLFTISRHPSNIILPLEISMVYLVSKKYKSMNLIMCDIIFWIFVGVPIQFLIYYSANTDLAKEFIYFTIAKDAINAIVNVLLVDLIFTYFPLVKRSKKGIKFTVKFKEVLFHVLLLSLLVPFVLNILLNGFGYYDESKKKFENMATSMGVNLEKTIGRWQEYQFRALKLDGLIQIGIVDDTIFDPLYKDELNYVRILMVDSNDEIIYNSKKDSSNIKRIEENNRDTNIINNTKNNVIKWAMGDYIISIPIETMAETISNYKVTLKVIIPKTELQKNMIEESLNEIRVLMVFSTFLMIAGIFINKNIFKIISRLAEITSDIPKELEKDCCVIWPTSSVFELNTLIENFKNTTARLKYMFHKSNVLSEQLSMSMRKLEEMAYIDILTGLDNRHSFNEYLYTVYKEYSKESENVSVMFIDLDHFKEINDFLGHATGDILLTQVSKRLKKVRNENVKVFRLGGDEFVVVIKSNNIDEVESVGDYILKEINAPFELKGGNYNITASIGVAIFPKDGNEMDKITKYSDIAMYHCKEKGGGYVQFFNDEIKNSFIETLSIESEIKAGIENGEFRVVFQPKINIKKEGVGGLEALVRWNSKTHGELSPNKFIPIAEESGLIIDIDDWVIRESCRINKKLQNMGLPKFPVAVNISPLHFAKGNLVQYVEGVLKETQLHANYLKLEITEGVFINNNDKVVNTILELNKLGVLVSIDDFGKGYSSINEIMTLPITEVKIDKHFVTDIHKDEKRKMVVKLIVELAHGFSLSVVAEGVESIFELSSIIKTGCDEIQGYLFSKPLEFKELVQFLKDSSERCKETIGKGERL
ncbi:MAG: putative bifunctional diguanylate cyclase/phosphodiesterase [Clostridium sp.]